MYGWESLYFNAKDGYAEALVRGLRRGLLTASEYTQLCQCETLEDMRLQLQNTAYGPALANEPAHSLTAATLFDRCTRTLVDEMQHLRCQAAQPLADFLDLITRGYMIDNVVSIVTGTLRERDVQELLDNCHPLGMFESIGTLAVAQNMRELYKFVLVDTPLAPYFSECLSCEDLDEMNIEIMRNTLYKAYLEDFSSFCEKMGGTTAEFMSEILSFEADRRAVTITINSVGTELTRDDRRKLYSNFGSLYPQGQQALAACEDVEQVRNALENYASFSAVTNRMGYSGGSSALLDKVFFEEEVKRSVGAFELQFHYGVFYAYLKLKEQEIRNLLWISECVAQDAKDRIYDGIVYIF